MTHDEDWFILARQQHKQHDATTLSTKDTVRAMPMLN
jgi:hypothetical protein